MLAEEKKFLSIPKAIGLFLIFHALFYRNQSDNFIANNALEVYATNSNNISFYTFLILGIILCYRFNKVLLFIIGSSFASTFFGYTQVIVNPHISQTHSALLIVSHIAIYGLLTWSHFKIVKINKMLARYKDK